MVILDTNIVIDHLRHTTSGESLLMRITKTHDPTTLALSPITIQELYEGTSTKIPAKLQAMLAVVTPLTLLPYTAETAQKAGEIARDLGRPIELADAAIATTTIIHNGQLATLNKKDFAGIPDLRFLDLRH